MKKLIIIFLLFFISSITIAQIYSDKKLLHQNFGVWKYNIDKNNTIAVHGYVTKQKILRSNNYQVKQKTISSLPEYRYELKMISKSIHNGDTTSTWLYGVRVYINGNEVTSDQFPDGFLVSIETKPTLIYWYETSGDNVVFEVKWINSIYEPRIIK